MPELEFKISSGLKNIIGKELITNDLIAIFELVKNSYDAKASKVRIIFQNIVLSDKTNKSKIFIIDNGNGMTKDDIENKFLFVGYSDKKGTPIEHSKKNFRDKIQKHRIFAGSKGVGRFSCDKLGAKLNLVTKTQNESKYHNLEIDWKKFEEDQKKEFEVIKADYEEGKSVNLKNIDLGTFNHGTIIEISELNGKWGEEELIKLKRYLQRLINPAQVRSDDNFKIFLEASEFENHDKESKKKGELSNVINGQIENFLFEKLQIKTTEINSSISPDGGEILSEVKDKGTFIFSLKGSNPYPKLKNIAVKIFYLNMNAKTAFKKIMGLDVVRYGSIFLYKNGIRIHPYGDEGDDWLEIEKRQTQGFRRFLSARNIMGRIEISGEQQDIIEISNREGGIFKNDSYAQLLDYVKEKVLKPLERFVVEGLDWDNPEKPKSDEDVKKDSLELIRKLTGQAKDENIEIKYNKDFLDILEKKEVEKAPEILKNIETINKFVKDKKTKDYVESQIRSLRGVIKITDKEIKGKEKEIEEKTKELLFLAKTKADEAGTISNLNHSIKDYAVSMGERLSEIKDLLTDKKSGLGEKLKSELLTILGAIHILSGKIKTLAEMINQAKFNTDEDELLETDMIEFIKQYLKNIGVYKLAVKFPETKNVFIKKFNPLELGLILDNFRSNSEKARANSIFFDFQLQRNKLVILIYDDGKGIKENQKNKLFIKGETTTGGSGLGLYNIREMLKNVNGTIDLAENSITKGACFRVIINGK